MLRFYEFVSNHPTFKKIEVDGLLFTTYDCPIEGAPLDYWTKENYFAYIVSGSLVWKTPEQEIMAKSGDAVFVNKGPHRVYRAPDKDFCALLIFMPDEFIKKVIQRHHINIKSDRSGRLAGSTSIISLDLDEILSVYFMSVLNYFSQSAPPSKSLLKIRFEELIVNILTGTGNKSLVAFFEDLCFDRKRSIKAIMEANFVFNFRTEEFAQLCGRSVASFKRDFAKAYNISPGKWLKKRRVKYGKFLLETTDLNINQIALESGFENTSHFIKSFKEMYKHPPLHFKKALATE